MTWICHLISNTSYMFFADRPIWTHHLRIYNLAKAHLSSPRVLDHPAALHCLMLALSSTHLYSNLRSPIISEKDSPVVTFCVFCNTHRLTKQWIIEIYCFAISDTRIITRDYAHKYDHVIILRICHKNQRPIHIIRQWFLKGTSGMEFIISYLGMKSWDLHVCDRASTITHVDRAKKSNPWYNTIWLCLNVTIWSSQICFSVIFIHFDMIQNIWEKNCTYSHFVQSPVTASAYFWSALKAC